MLFDATSPCSMNIVHIHSILSINLFYPQGNEKNVSFFLTHGNGIYVQLKTIVCMCMFAKLKTELNGVKKKSGKKSKQIIMITTMQYKHRLFVGGFLLSPFFISLARRTMVFLLNKYCVSILHICMKSSHSGRSIYVGVTKSVSVLCVACVNFPT